MSIKSINLHIRFLPKFVGIAEIAEIAGIAGIAEIAGIAKIAGIARIAEIAEIVGFAGIARCQNCRQFARNFQQFAGNLPAKRASGKDQYCTLPDAILYQTTNI